jgi:hypothetical protein
MNPPTTLTRFLSTRRVSAALYVGCPAAVLGWFGGAVPWWLALLAFCLMGTVSKAVNQARRYDAWRASWDAMGAPAQAAAPTRMARKRNDSTIHNGAMLAAILLAIIPLIGRAPGAGEDVRNGLAILWLGMAGYLIIKLAMRFGRARTSVKAPAMPAPGKHTAGVDVVEWVLPRASSCPSRADAMRRLPEYSARLLQ